MGTGSYSASSTVTAQISNKNPRKVAIFDAGAPTECISNAEVLEKPQEKEKKDTKAELERQQRKIDMKLLRYIVAARVARDNQD